MVAALASESPIARTLPARTSSAIAPTVSSIGVLRIHAMLVVQVDRLDAEALQRRLTTLPHVVRLSADAQERAVGAAPVAEFGSDDDLVAPRADETADELLVGERAIDVRGIEERDAEVQRALQGGHRSRFVGRLAIELRHPHAAKPHRRDGDS